MEFVEALKQLLKANLMRDLKILESQEGIRCHKEPQDLDGVVGFSVDIAPFATTEKFEISVTIK